MNSEGRKASIDDADLDDEGIVIDEEDPEWTEEDFARAKPIDEVPEMADFAEFIRNGGRVRMPGEPPPRRVTLELDPEGIDHFKAGGRGWQTRINAALRKAAGL